MLATHFSADNPIRSCRYNERLILHLLRLHRRESKANLARLSGLTAAAMGSIVTSLEKKGLVNQVGKLQGDMGQPATLYALEASGAYGLGVSINRGEIETVLINFSGEVVAGKKHPLILPQPLEVLNLVMADFTQMLKSLDKDAQSRIAGIGVALPFHLGSWENESGAFKDWLDFDFGLALERECGLPVLVENDGNMAALAELIYGTGQREKDFCYLYFGSPMVKSLGGGVVIGGEVRRGASGNAGDLGLIRVPSTQADKQWVALTDRCSLNALVRHLKNQGHVVESRSDLRRCQAEYPEQVAGWLSDCIDALQHAIFAIQAVLDISCLVLDCQEEDRALVQQIAKALDKQLQAQSKPSQPLPRIVMGTFSSDAAAIGAATMPLDEIFSLRD